MELHDRKDFEVFAYYCGIDREDATRARIRASVDRWVDIARLSDDEAAARIAAAQRPVIIAGIELHRYGLQADAVALAEASGIPIAAFEPAPAVSTRIALIQNHPNNPVEFGR